MARIQSVADILEQRGMVSAIDPSYVVGHSRTLAQARRNSLHLYRRALKSVPQIKRYYAMPYSVEQMRKKIRHEFTRRGNLTDPQLVDHIVINGFNLLEEAYGNFTFRAYVWNFFESIREDEPKIYASIEDKMEAELMDRLKHPGVHRHLNSPFADF